jgi:phosphoribosylaminoimidazole-succinocarboxamide synthase
MITQQIKNNLPFDDQNYLMVEYPDYFFPAKNKKVRVKHLGQKFVSINQFFYDYLKEYHIPCVYVKDHKKNSLVYLKFRQLPFSIKILNCSDKRTAKIFSIKEGLQLELPIFEYHFGISKDSIVSESHLIAFDLCTMEDLRVINRICSKINAVLKAFFERRHETIAEFTCSFGKHDDKIYLVDDFSPLSLKVFPNGDKNGWANPYSLNTSSEMRKYTEPSMVIQQLV